ncbi:MAG: ABC transporter ATP-binding protein [Thermomicrobiales bacterium]|nr:ABC transporter ATP-binding protein [Thermomicrobiales bacterium]
MVLALTIESRLKSTMLSVSIEMGNEVVCLIGPSGSGKSVVLRSIAGVFQPDNGSIEILGRQVLSTGLGVNLPPRDRYVGFVPQSHALFDHLTVDENIAYPLLKVNDLQPAVVATRVDRLCDLLELDAVRDLYPHDLTPVMLIRVALGRALVTDPDVLLLDDPLGHLDREMRKSVRDEIGELLRHIGVPTLFATVELEEGYQIADRVGLLDSGRLLQIDEPRALMLHPANRRVAGLVRSVNVYEGRVVRVTGDTSTIETTIGVVQVPLAASVGEKVDVVIRPEHVQILPAASGTQIENGIPGTIAEVVPLGDVRAVTIAVSGPRGQVNIEAFAGMDVIDGAGLDVGRRCVALLPTRALHIMPAPSELP